MKDLEKLEDCRLPEVGSEKVKKCMQEAVERALQFQKENDEAGEHYTITVENFPKIFHTLSDCDFRNEECVNNAFKMIIDRVFDNIAAHEVLGILNDAYAIAIDAMNTEYPEYEVPYYCRFANTPLRSADEKAMVMAYVAYLVDTENITGKILHNIFENSHHAEVFYITICRYRHLLFEYRSRKIDNITFSSEKLQIFTDLDEALVSTYQDTYDLLDAIVRYAEALPADEWSAVRVIGRMLHAKGAAGRYIPNEIYSEYEQRIDILANCPKPEQGEVPVPAPHPGGEVQEEEPQETPTAAHPSEPSVQGTSAPLAPTPTPKRAGKKGARAKSLFTDLDVSREQAEVFLSFLQKENLISQLVDCKQDNDITAAFLCFCDHWKSAVKGFCFTAPAGARFLRDECGLNFDCGVDSYENILRREKNKPRKIHWKSKVEDFLSGHN